VIDAIGTYEATCILFDALVNVNALVTFPPSSFGANALEVSCTILHTVGKPWTIDGAPPTTIGRSEFITTKLEVSRLAFALKLDGRVVIDAL
jgi:hypothetical protein